MGSTNEKSPSGAPRFELEGEYWTLAYGGAVLRLRDSKGLRYLACLLAHPGERIGCTMLLQITAGAGTGSKAAARSAVTKRIRDAIQKISGHHASLGHHLSTCVRTGYECRYATDPERPVTWSF